MIRMRLSAGEYVVVAARPQSGVLLWPAILALLVLGAGGYWLGWTGRDGHSQLLLDWFPLLVPAVLVVMGLIFLRWVLLPVMRWSASRYLLTSKRLLARRGVLRRREHEVQLAVIYQLESSQTLLERMSGGGTLTIGLGRDRTITYPNVPQIQTFKEYIVAAIGELPLTVMFDGIDMDRELGPQTEWTDNDRAW